MFKQGVVIQENEINHMVYLVFLNNDPLLKHAVSTIYQKIEKDTTCVDQNAKSWCRHDDISVCVGLSLNNFGIYQDNFGIYQNQSCLSLIDLVLIRLIPGISVLFLHSYGISLGYARLYMFIPCLSQVHPLYM